MTDDTDDGVEVLALSGVGKAHTAQSHCKLRAKFNCSKLTRVLSGRNHPQSSSASRLKQSYQIGGGFVVLRDSKSTSARAELELNRLLLSLVISVCLQCISFRG
jgi:hypothetical protein